jgi:hypothetical protein
MIMRFAPSSRWQLIEPWEISKDDNPPRIDETLNDQCFKPRPRKIQERDILTLNEPSSEFEANHVTAEAQASEIHSEAA